MTDISLETVQSSIQLIKDIKTLFVVQNPYLPVYSAIGGAAVGAMASIIPTSINSWFKDKRDRKVLSFQLYAEIKAALEVAEARQYANQLRQIVSLLKSGQHSSYSY